MKKKEANLLRLTVRDDPIYIAHLKKLKQAHALVDDKAPSVRRSTLWLKPNHRIEYLRLARIANDNEKLLEKLNVIQRSKGRIDSHNPLAGHHHSRYMTNLHERISKIDEDNTELYKKFMRRGPEVINNQELLKLWRINLAKIRERCRYEYVVQDRKAYQCDDSHRLQSAPNQSRTQIFIEFTVENGLTLGCVNILLFDDIVPKLVNHFLSSLSQIIERRKQHEKAISIQVERIFPNLYAEFTMPKIDNNNSMVELKIDDYGLPIDCPGALAMIPAADNQLSSKYALTFKSLTALNGIFTVFGQLCGGWSVVDVLEGWGRKHGTPIEGVYISNCGIVN